MRYVLGIDLGTASLKAVLLGEDGAIAAGATRDYAMHSPQPGWAEQDPEDWWRACCAATQALLAQVAVGPEHVSALAVCSQMHGTVLLDAAGTLLRPAIAWPDTRTVAEAAEAHATLAARGLLARLGGGVSPGFMLASLLWCRAHEPAVWQRVAHSLLPKDWLRYRLTGVLAGEPSDGSGIPAVDLDSGQWSVEALGALDLPAALMPPMGESAAPAGTVHEAAAAATGLQLGTPVLCGGSDQAMAAIGAGLLHPGSLLLSISTGGQLVAPVSSPAIQIERGLRTICHALPAGTAKVAPSRFSGGYLAHSATLSAGLTVHWLRDTLFQAAGAEGDARLLAEAAQAPAGAGGLLFLPYLAGERSPIMDPAASGVLLGLRLEHERAHIARAALEGIAFSLRHALEPLREAGVETHRVVLVGGLARSPLVRRIVAGVVRQPLLPLASAEQSALGSALLAAVHVGFFTSLDEACGVAVHYEAPVEPVSADAARYEQLYAQYRGVYPLLRETMPFVQGAARK